MALANDGNPDGGRSARRVYNIINGNHFLRPILAAVPLSLRGSCDAAAIPLKLYTLKRAYLI